MSAIISLKIKRIFSDFEKKIKILKLLHDELTFRIILDDSIKLLLSMSQQIKNKDNLFGKNIAIELLVNIISFLPYEYVTICKNVCKIWFNNLKSNLSKKILLPVPKKMRFSKLFSLGFKPLTITKIKKHIYITDYENFCKINTKNNELFTRENENIYKNLIYSNNDYICLKSSNNIEIFSSDMKLINIIKIKNFQDFIIDDKNNILVVRNNSFNIYTLGGKIINKWNLVDNTYTKGLRKIAYNDGEIFMVDSHLSRIYVFSYEGKIIRYWGNYGKYSKNFENPCGIAIYRDVVFVVDSGNRRIQAFTLNGKYIFEYSCEDFGYISNIIIIDKYAYINDSTNKYIIKIEIIYDQN